MGVMSDPGLDLLSLETLAEHIAALAHTARTGPSPRDREEAMAHLLEQGKKLALYIAPPKLPVMPSALHKDSDDFQEEA